MAVEELQANITAHQMSVELLELQETLSWPSLASLCPDSYIPEVSCFIPLHASALSAQPYYTGFITRAPTMPGPVSHIL